MAAIRKITSPTKRRQRPVEEEEAHTDVRTRRVRRRIHEQPEQDASAPEQERPPKQRRDLREFHFESCTITMHFT